MPDTIMIFAAGLGTRMAPLTDNLPKPLIKIAGVALIDHALKLTDTAGIEKIVVNLHYLPAQMKVHLQQRPEVLSIHEEIPLETGGGLKNALPALGPSPVLTLNPDAIWTGNNPLVALRRAWEPKKMDGLLMLIPQAQALAHTGPGDFTVSNEGLVARCGDNPAAPFVYTGAQIIKTAHLADIDLPVFSLNLLWDKMIRNRRLFGIEHRGCWVDLGHPGGIAVAERILKGADHA
jgi:N-acetyl-alpha-D-muramate 1-phosphate uridylyltransferase